MVEMTGASLNTDIVEESSKKKEDADQILALIFMTILFGAIAATGLFR